MDKIERLEQYRTELEAYLAQSTSEAINSAVKTLKLQEVILLYIGAERYSTVIDRLKNEFGVDLADQALQGLFDANKRSQPDLRPICSCKRKNELRVDASRKGKSSN